MHRLAPPFAFLGLLLLINLPIILLSFLIQFSSALQEGGFRTALIVCGSLVYALSAAGMAFWFWRIYRRRTQPEHFAAPAQTPSVGRQLLWSAVYLGLLLALSPVYEAVCSALGLPGWENLANQQALEALFRQMPLLLAVHSVLFAPVAEELLFRGIFFSGFGRLEQRGKRYALLAFSALLFAAVHALPTEPGFLLYFCMGCVLGGAYLHTRQLRYPVLIHTLNNLLGIAAFYFPQQ